MSTLEVGSIGHPRVSIALCTYNGARYLREQLDSLLSQSHPNIEIVATDDASQDESQKVLHHYASLDSRVSVVTNSKRLGFSSNFSATLQRCSGSYICPCDQDDIWHPDKITRLLKAIQGHDLVYCDSAMVNSEGVSLNRRLSQDRGMYSGRDPLTFLLTNCISGHAMLFRRSLLDRAKPFPSGIYYDWWISIVAATGNGVLYVDEPLVYFRRHQSTVTSFGNVRKPIGIKMRAFLEERIVLLDAMKRLQSARQMDIERLHDALRHWLDEGRGWLFLKELWRHHRAVLHVLRPRLPQVALQSFKYLTHLGRRP